MSDTPAPGGLRHAVDRVGALGIEGWALRDDGQAVDVALHHGGEPVPCHLQRLPRPDVLQHLGLPPTAATLDSGFLLRPEGQAWHQRFGQREVACTLVLDGQPAAELMLGLAEAELCAWLDTLVLRPRDDAERGDEWQHLRPFVDAAGGELAAWAHARWAEAPADTTVHRAVDRVDGLRVTGWAWAPPGEGAGEGAGERAGEREHFTLRCARQAWPLAVRRVERQDVAQALPGAGARAGFEFELPAAIWAATGPAGDAWVQVSVNGQPLWARPLRVARQAPLQALARAVSAGPGPQSRGRGWGWMHVLAAGLWAQVPAGVDAWLRGALAEPERALLPPRAPVAAAAGRATPDADAPAVWRLQQAFNQALAGEGDPARALDQVLAQAPEPPPPVRRAFLASLVPGFCAAGALPALRDRLGGQPIAELIPGNDRWAQSLRLPLLVDDELAEGRLTRAVEAAATSAAPGPAAGWTPHPLRLSLARLREALAGGQVVDDEELQQFVGHLLALWADLGADPAWSRLADQSLIEAQVNLLGLLPSLGEAQAAQVVDTALRLYALTPAFWQAVDAAGPADLWPAPVAEAAAVVRPVLAAVAAGQPQALVGEAARAMFAWARRLGCVDAPLWQRHALAQARHEPALAAALAEGLPAADGWRVGPPGPGAQRAWRAVDPVSEARARRAGRRLAGLGACGALGPAGTWLAVAGERAGFAAKAWPWRPAGRPATPAAGRS
ncbi:MAG: hypothetical protein U1F53_17800 [Burkholderiaceae bacterium]